MRIVDSQVHIWAAATAERPWPSTTTHLPAPHKPEPITQDDLLREMNAAGVERAVLISPVFEGTRNDVVLAAARAHPDRFAAMGRFDPDAPGARDLMPAWLQQTGMRGLRFTFHRPHQRPLLTEGRIDWLWPQAERAGAAVMMLVAHHDLHCVDRIAERHPGLKLAIDHLGLTEGKDEAAFRDLYQLLALARRPNVAVKVSCLPLYTADTYPFAKLHPYVRRVYDAFGPQRMFWGSDLSRLPCSYRQCVTMFTEAMPWLTDADLQWIMGRGVCEWLGWELPHD